MFAIADPRWREREQQLGPLWRQALATLHQRQLGPPAERRTVAEERLGLVDQVGGAVGSSSSMRHSPSDSRA